MKTVDPTTGTSSTRTASPVLGLGIQQSDIPHGFEKKSNVSEAHLKPGSPLIKTAASKTLVELRPERAISTIDLNALQPLRGTPNPSMFAEVHGADRSLEAGSVSLYEGPSEDSGAPDVAHSSRTGRQVNKDLQTGEQRDLQVKGRKKRSLWKERMSRPLRFCTSCEKP